MEDSIFTVYCTTGEANKNKNEAKVLTYGMPHYFKIDRNNPYYKFMVLNNPDKFVDNIEVSL